jgi:hypothetical protein
MAIPRRIEWAPDGRALRTPPVEAMKSLRLDRVDTGPLLIGEMVNFYYFIDFLYQWENNCFCF